MIAIIQGQANTITVTVTENVTLPNPVFLFRFTNEATRTVNTCIATNASAYTRRYDQFVITESSTENRTGGTLQLAYAGFWKYEVFEQTSNTELNVTTQNLLEHGVCQVIESSPVNTYIEHDGGDTYIE